MLVKVNKIQITKMVELGVMLVKVNKIQITKMA
jgi:hypothetical protein